MGKFGVSICHPRHGRVVNLGRQFKENIPDNDASVISRDMCELLAAGCISDCENTAIGCPQAAICFNA